MLRRALPCVAVLVLLLTGDVTAMGGTARAVWADDGIHKIEHVVIIMQENRSFDSYFGSIPAPTASRCATAFRSFAFPIRRPTVRAPVPRYERRKHRRTHGAKAADLVIDGGKMDGFIAVMHAANRTGGCPTDIPTCVVKGHETSVMGYHTSAELPTIGPTRATSFFRIGCSSRCARGVSQRTCTWSRSGPAAARSSAIQRVVNRSDLFRRWRSTAGSLHGRRLRSVPAGPTTRGRTSPTCSTPTTSRGRTT